MYSKNKIIKLANEAEDIDKLDELGFFWDEESDGFISFRFGSC